MLWIFFLSVHISLYFGQFDYYFPCLGIRVHLKILLTSLRESSLIWLRPWYQYGAKNLRKSHIIELGKYNAIDNMQSFYSAIHSLRYTQLPADKRTTAPTTASWPEKRKPQSGAATSGESFPTRARELLPYVRATRWSASHNRG